jgi:predicted cupin superfamily sugar epimerase
MSEPSAQQIIARLQLAPHPEGGHYREVFRSAATVEHPSAGHDARRSAMTSIYFLLEDGERSAWHRVRSDEAWCLLAGGPLELHMLGPDGQPSMVMLGAGFESGQSMQAVVPANWWQAAQPAPGARFVLCACIVAPGFDFADFDLAGREQLAAQYPTCRDLVARFTD